MDLSRTVFVDNLTSSFYTNLDAGVPIIPFTGDINDRAMLSLARFLKNIAFRPDISRVLADSFSFSALRSCNSFAAALKLYIELHDTN